MTKVLKGHQETYRVSNCLREENTSAGRISILFELKSLQRRKTKIRQKLVMNNTSCVITQGTTEKNEQVFYFVTLLCN